MLTNVVSVPWMTAIILIIVSQWQDQMISATFVCRL